MKYLQKSVAAVLLTCSAAVPAMAGALNGDARASIPYDVQQLIVIDYRAMQNSRPAMELRDRVVPPELKRLEQSLKTSGLNDNQQVDQLAFASFRPQNTSGVVRVVGIAQGQFEMRKILASFKAQKIKPEMVRLNKVYPMGTTGERICFLNADTFLFGQAVAVRSALDARDGNVPSMLSNQTLNDLIPSVENDAVWSVLDQKGTQVVMHNLLNQGGSGAASGVGDFESVKKRLLGSRYGMDFQNGVSFSLDVIASDRVSAATMSAILNAAVLYKKVAGSDTEKTALEATKVTSDGGTLHVNYAASDNQFASLLQSNLFMTVVK